MSEKKTEGSQTNNYTEIKDEQPSSLLSEQLTVEEFTKDGFQFIVNSTKYANALPTGSSRDLYCAQPSYMRIIKHETDKILDIISHVLKHQDIKGNIKRRDNDEKMELLLECNDIMLERVNSLLDELSGIKKNPETILIETEISTNSIQPKKASGSWNEQKNTPNSLKRAKLLTAKNILRPQVNFKIPVDNSDVTPFEPRLKYKPNSIKPLAILPEYDEDGNIESYLHPYEFELNKFVVPSEQFFKTEPKVPTSLDETPLIFIDNTEKLAEVLLELNSATEMAIDLEHHSYRTFQGITCLMQISTRKKDYIFDTLVLRDELHVLNEIFTKPNVVKIFHGADSDIEWLQRDLSLYIVNMFDTHLAAKRLNFARLSLAYLLKHYCNLDLDKTFQLADWRIRPLPEELLVYARQDTHYLLYIYDLMRNELLRQGNEQKHLLESVYQFSTELCKKRYVKVRMYPDSHLDLYRKSKRIFDNRQLFALKEIYTWRDKISREEDESYGYVLPNHMMLQISENLPREIQGILACCNPIPPLLRQHLNFLHQIILKAREQPLVKLVTEEQMIKRNVASTNYKDINSPLYCPHDLSRNSEFRNDLPTLLGRDLIINLPKCELAKPTLSIFDTPDCSEEENDVKKIFQKIKEIKFISPYARYLTVLPFVEEQKKLALKKEAEEAGLKKLCPVATEKEKNPTELTTSISTNRKTENDETFIVNKVLKSDSGNKISFNDMKKLKKEQKEATESVSTDIVISTENISDKTNAITSNNSKASNRSKNLKRKLLSKSHQASNSPVDFDYSKVDYKRFQGGSKVAKTPTQFDSKFKGRVQKTKNADKKFNKMFSFSNVYKKK